MLRRPPWTKSHRHSYNQQSSTVKQSIFIWEEISPGFPTHTVCVNMLYTCGPEIPVTWPAVPRGFVLHVFSCDDWCHHCLVKSSWVPCNLAHLPLDKMAPISQRHFGMHFHQWKVLWFDSNFTGVCSWGSNWQYVSIGSGNGLVPNRRQTITWTKADLVHWCIYAALKGDELKSQGSVVFSSISAKFCNDNIMLCRCFLHTVPVWGKSAGHWWINIIISLLHKQLSCWDAMTLMCIPVMSCLTYSSYRHMITLSMLEIKLIHVNKRDAWSTGCIVQSSKFKVFYLSLLGHWPLQAYICKQNHDNKNTSNTIYNQHDG